MPTWLRHCLFIVHTEWFDSARSCFLHFFRILSFQFYDVSSIGILIVSSYDFTSFFFTSRDLEAVLAKFGFLSVLSFCCILLFWVSGSPSCYFFPPLISFVSRSLFRKRYEEKFRLV